MTMNENNKRVITIKSENPEWTVRIASKLLLGKGKWEVLWGERLIKVTVGEDQLPQLAKALTTPVIQHGIEACGDVYYAGNSDLWEIWKKETRFTDLLLTEELYQQVREDLLEQLECSDMFLVTTWARGCERFDSVIQSVQEEMQEEGRMATTLQNSGWK